LDAGEALRRVGYDVFVGRAVDGGGGGEGDTTTTSDGGSGDGGLGEGDTTTTSDGGAIVAATMVK
jgi:hypothetical protein